MRPENSRRSSASGESASSTRSAQTFPPTSSRYVLIASQSMLGLAIRSTDGSTWRMALLVLGAVVLVQSAVVQRWSVVPNPTFDRRGREPPVSLRAGAADESGQVQSVLFGYGHNRGLAGLIDDVGAGLGGFHQRRGGRSSLEDHRGVIVDAHPRTRQLPGGDPVPEGLGSAGLTMVVRACTAGNEPEPIVEWDQGPEGVGR